MGWIEHNAAGTKWRGKYRAGGRRIGGPWLDYRHEAEQWWKDAEGVTEEIVEPEVPATLAAYAEEWLTRRGKIAVATTEYYRTQVDLGILRDPIGKLALDEVRRPVIEVWATRQLATGAAARNARVKVLRMICGDAVDDERCPMVKDPTRKIRKAKGEIRERVYLAPEDIEALLAEGDSTFRLLVLLAADAGLRWEEMAALAVGSVVTRGSSMTLHIWQSVGREREIRNDTKNHEPRDVPVVTERLRRALITATREARLRAPGDGRDALVLTADSGRAFGKVTRRANGKFQASYPIEGGRRVRREFADADEARAWIASNRPVTTEPLAYGTYLGKFHAAATRAGIYPEPSGWHDLRHTFGSALAEQGVPTKMIGSLMGHSDTRVTEIYMHASTQATLSQAMGAALAGR